MAKLTDILSELAWCKQRERACREALNGLSTFLSTDISEASTTLKTDDGSEVSQEAIKSIAAEIESVVLVPLQKRIHAIGELEVDGVIKIKEENEQEPEQEPKPIKIGRRRLRGVQGTNQ